jgi:MoxR-like ATPase
VAIDDVRIVIFPALRHRLLLNFEAMADGVDPDEIINAILSDVRVP